MIQNKKKVIKYDDKHLGTKLTFSFFILIPMVSKSSMHFRTVISYIQKYACYMYKVQNQSRVFWNIDYRVF